MAVQLQERADGRAPQQRRRGKVLAGLHRLVLITSRMDWCGRARGCRLPPWQLTGRRRLSSPHLQSHFKKMHARVGKTRLPDGGRPHPRVEPAVVEKVVVER